LSIIKILVVVLKIEKEVQELWQSVGVRQGDNMAPVLFLFLMSAFAETLEIEWKNTSISVCMVQSVIGTELANGRGKLHGHLPKDYLSRSLTAVEILQCLYIDDRAFIFTTCADLTKGLNLIYKHFARFGLEMHIGQEGSPSKTECVFFPPPWFFDSHLPTLQQGSIDFNNTLEDEHDDIITANDRHDKQKAQTRQDQEGALYNELEETRPIDVDDGSVTFCRHFKYLGSFVFFSLCNNFDIENQATAATQSMGALKNVWNSPHLDIRSKYLLFRAIPMNLLLWGCETWLIQKALLNKHEVFLHCNIR
jgi:hypothetical protein